MDGPRPPGRGHSRADGGWRRRRAAGPLRRRANGARRAAVRGRSRPAGSAARRRALVAARTRSGPPHRHLEGEGASRRRRRRDCGRRAGRALVWPDRTRLAGIRRGRRGGALRRRRAGGGGRVGPAHGQRGCRARRGGLRSAACRARPSGVDRARRAARQPEARERPLALVDPPGRRRRRAGVERPCGARDVADTADRAPVSRARERAGRARPRRRSSPLQPGAGDLRRPPPGRGVPRAAGGAGLRHARAQRRRVRRQGGHVGPGADRAARARDWPPGEAHAQPRGVDPPAPQAPPDSDGVRRRLRRRRAPDGCEGADARRLRRLCVGRREGSRTRGRPRLRSLQGGVTSTSSRSPRTPTTLRAAPCAGSAPTRRTSPWKGAWTCWRRRRGSTRGRSAGATPSRSATCSPPARCSRSRSASRRRWRPSSRTTTGRGPRAAPSASRAA